MCLSGFESPLRPGIQCSRARVYLGSEVW